MVCSSKSQQKNIMETANPRGMASHPIHPPWISHWVVLIILTSGLQNCSSVDNRVFVLGPSFHHTHIHMMNAPRLSLFFHSHVLLWTQMERPGTRLTQTIILQCYNSSASHMILHGSHMIPCASHMILHASHMIPRASHGIKSDNAPTWWGTWLLSVCRPQTAP